MVRYNQLTERNSNIKLVKKLTKNYKNGILLTPLMYENG